MLGLVGTQPAPELDTLTGDQRVRAAERAVQLIRNAAALMKLHDDEDARVDGINGYLQDAGLFPLILTYMLGYQITIGFTGPREPANR